MRSLCAHPARPVECARSLADCFFYYFERSSMFGFMQTSFFFGYMLMASYAAFIMLGTVGFASSLLFVGKIYRAIKCD